MNATMTSTEAMAALGVSRTYIWKQICAGNLPATLDATTYPPVYRIPTDAVRRLRPQLRRWTDDEEDKLVRLLGRVPVHVIAKRLRRTETAVRQRMKRLGHSQRSEWYTANVTARELGVSSRTVCHWIRTGELATLPYRPVWGANRCHLIAHEEIERFIRERIAHPHRRHHWNWRQMPQGYFRNYAAICRGNE